MFGLIRLPTTNTHQHSRPIMHCSARMALDELRWLHSAIGQAIARRRWRPACKYSRGIPKAMIRGPAGVDSYITSADVSKGFLHFSLVPP